MRTQRLLMPVSGAESWTVIDEDLVPVAPAERYLSHLAAIKARRSDPEMHRDRVQSTHAAPHQGDRTDPGRRADRGGVKMLTHRSVTTTSDTYVHLTVEVVRSELVRAGVWTAQGTSR